MKFFEANAESMCGDEGHIGSPVTPSVYSTAVSLSSYQILISSEGVASFIWHCARAKILPSPKKINIYVVFPHIAEMCFGYIQMRQDSVKKSRNSTFCPKP